MKTVRYYSISSIALFLIIGLCYFPFNYSKREESGPVRTLSNSEWDTITSGGQRFGYKDAPITIVEFVDFQCIHCKEFSDILTRYMEKHPKQINVIVHNFPLPQHRQADMAAISAICVSKMGNYKKYYHLLFKNQDEFYEQPWDSLAQLAGVKDIKTFNNRLKNDRQIRTMIRNDVRMGIRIGLRETPTIIINRVMFSGPISYSQLKNAVNYNLQSK